MDGRRTSRGSGTAVTVVPCKCLISLEDMKEQSSLAADVAIRDAED
jgi:hypothetical protein